MPRIYGLCISQGVLAALFLASFTQAGSIYLIAGEPENFSEYQFIERNFRPVVLYRLEERVIEKVRTIATRRQSSLAVHIFHDTGYGVVVSSGVDRKSFLLDVLLLDHVDRQNSIEVHPDCENGVCLLLSSSLSRIGDDRRFSLQADGLFVAVDLLRSTSLKNLTRNEYESSAYRFGRARYLTGRVDGGLREMNGILGILTGRGNRVYPVGWSLPSFMPANEWKSIGWSIETDYMRVITGTKLEPTQPDSLGRSLWTWHVLDKQNGQWSEVETLGERYQTRAFGNWLAFQERDLDWRESFDFTQVESHQASGFLNAADRFKMHHVVPTGRFLLYDVRSKRKYAIDTKEPNSEILYVENDGGAYFRVSNEIWRVPFADDRLGDPVVLAKQPEIWAMHWLFKSTPEADQDQGP